MPRIQTATRDTMQTDAAANTEPVMTNGAPPIGLAVNHVPLDAPWDWLSRGWNDVVAEPLVSIVYGLIFAVAAWIMTFGLAQLEAESFIPALAGGFLLLGPLFAAGLYEIARRREKGEPVSAFGAFAIGSGAYSRLALFGIVLFLAFFVWVLAAFVLLTLFLGTSAVPAPSELVHTLLFTNAGLGLLITGTIVGALIAAAVFCISTVAAPLLLDRDIDIVSAIVTSVRAVSTNPGPTLLWAVLIAGFMILGVATLFVGLVVAFPLLGYATWHAYRALVV